MHAPQVSSGFAPLLFPDPYLFLVLAEFKSKGFFLEQVKQQSAH